ncbi:MAG: hypothetical protein AAB267_09765 [Candidatus Desantisbacteria bacterium]
MAEGAPKVAAYCGNGKGCCPRKEMEERLLFNRVKMKAAALSIDKAKESAVYIPSHATYSCFIGLYLASVSTEMTFYLLLFQLLIKKSLFHSSILPDKALFVKLYRESNRFTKNFLSVVG